MPWKLRSILPIPGFDFHLYSQLLNAAASDPTPDNAEVTDGRWRKPAWRHCSLKDITSGRPDQRLQRPEHQYGHQYVPEVTETVSRLGIALKAFIDHCIRDATTMLMHAVAIGLSYVIVVSDQPQGSSTLFAGVDHVAIDRASRPPFRKWSVSSPDGVTCVLQTVRECVPCLGSLQLNVVNYQLKVLTGWNLQNVLQLYTKTKTWKRLQAISFLRTF